MLSLCQMHVGPMSNGRPEVAQKRSARKQTLLDIAPNSLGTLLARRKSWLSGLRRVVPRHGCFSQSSSQVHWPLVAVTFRVGRVERTAQIRKLPLGSPNRHPRLSQQAVRRCRPARFRWKHGATFRGTSPNALLFATKSPSESSVKIRLPSSLWQRSWTRVRGSTRFDSVAGSVSIGSLASGTTGVA